MNRQQRRATEKAAAALPLDALMRQASLCRASGRLEEAALHYERAAKLAPDDAELLNNLGAAYLELGQLQQASEIFARVIDVKATTLDDVAGTLNTAVEVAPGLREAIGIAFDKWPERPPITELFAGDSFAKSAADPLLRKLMRSVAIRDVGFERLLTGLRRNLTIGRASEPAPLRRLLDFYGALAEQCFINEYIYAAMPDERAQHASLRFLVEAAIAEGSAIREEDVIVLAMYAPLETLANAYLLTQRKFSDPVKKIIAQQIEEPAQERSLNASIPALTAIDDAVSQAVRDQYEANPYPRWIKVSVNRKPDTLPIYLERMVPGATFEPPPASGDMLIAGCGTGRHAIEMTSKIGGMKVLAIDLSKASLAYALRKTPPELASRLSYSQADLLKIRDINRSFDIISVAGVLHHMQDPMAGWRNLDALLKPNGFMHVGLYSESARQKIVEARQFIAAKGYKPTADGIRDARQAIIDNPDLNLVTRWGDFYSMSDCRDLLFHVQEHRFTIPKIKTAIDELGLRFLGFILPPPLAETWRNKFAQKGWKMEDLARWDAVEQDNPMLFAGMYQFWLQKRR